MPKITHGAEQEIQIVDERGMLQNRVRDLMESVPSSLSGGKNRKFIKDAYDTQLEIVTGITKDLDELRSELIFLRLLGHEAAESHGLYLISTGTNPFTVSRPGENFGEHHHIGARNAREKVTLHNFFREFTPELMALSVNSPIYLPTKSEKFESYRATRNPHIGYSPRIDLSKYLKGKSLSHLRNKRYLDVTPFTKGGKPTVETRLFDVQLSVPKTVMIGAILETIGLRALRYAKERRIPPRINPHIIVNNRREALKHGLRAKFLADTDIRYSMEFMYHSMGGKNTELPAFRAIEHMLIYLEEEFEELGIDWRKDRILEPAREAMRYKLTSADCQYIIFKKYGKAHLVEKLIEWTKRGSMGRDLPIFKIHKELKTKEVLT